MTDAGTRSPVQPASDVQIEAMISLLTDTSSDVVRTCREALQANAERAEPRVAEHLEQAPEDQQRLLRRVLADLRGDALEQDVLAVLVGDDGVDLLEGSLRIGRLVHTGLGTDGVEAALDAMADQVMSQLKETRDLEADIGVLRRVLVEQSGLVGVPVEDARLEDALLDQVTSAGCGMPLPLCMAWLLVARRAGLPLVGVNMPGHFLLRYGEGHDVILDPFHEGRVVPTEVCQRYLASQQIPTTDLSVLDATDVDMLLRTLRNLVNLGGRDGERLLVARCARLLEAAGQAYGL